MVLFFSAIEDETLGRGSIAGDEYRYDMETGAHRTRRATAHWVETCFCDPPLAEERPYWEKYFELLSRERCALAPQLPARKRNGSLGMLRLRLHAQAGREMARRRTNRFCEAAIVSERRILDP